MRAERVSTLELFFDLVFVFTITQLTVRLADALAALPAGRHAFEFRHESWFADEVYELLRRNDGALVIADRPEIKRFQAHEPTADWMFVRFHYGSRGRRGNYSERELGGGAARLEACGERAEVLANSTTIGGASPSAARSRSSDDLLRSTPALTRPGGAEQFATHDGASRWPTRPRSRREGSPWAPFARISR